MFVGYHGTSSTHVPSLLAGIKSAGSGQLGTGFYTTMSIPAAEHFALLSVDAAWWEGLPSGDPVIVKIFMKRVDYEGMVGVEVKEPLWYKIPDHDELITNYDYLDAPISRFEYWPQRKFNPRIVHKLTARL